MSFLSSLVSTIEADATAAEKWVVGEVETLVSEAVSSILLPFFKEIEPQIVADLETVLTVVAKDAGQAVVDYLTGQPVGKIMTDIIGQALADGYHLLALLEPEALTVLVSLKTLALKGVSDAESALGIGTAAPV